MKKKVIGLFGGSGFVGQSLAFRLARQGYLVRIFTRRRKDVQHLWMNSSLEIVEVNLADTTNLSRAISGCTSIVNLIGILNEKKDNGKEFLNVHVQILENILFASNAEKISHFLQISALNANVNGNSFYLKSKGFAENLLKDHFNKHFGTPKAFPEKITIIKPSVVFGAKDAFTNKFASLVRYMPLFFPLAKGNVNFQPVYIEDLTSLIIRCMEKPDKGVSTIHVGGPEIYTLEEIVILVAKVTGHKTRVLALSNFFSWLQANIFEYLPGKPFSRDNFRSLSKDSVCPKEPIIQGERVETQTTSIKAILPIYLRPESIRKMYSVYRANTKKKREPSNNDHP
jgi:nucleoside-diphosphate-sugar epimerase